jgi:4-amino-4-deoxy-L-arabinose transferase-like glycosyltransferase
VEGRRRHSHRHRLAHAALHGDWLSPDLAGRAFHEPPLYYWSAALTGKIFGWLLPLHEAMRLASGLWVTWH